MLNVFIDGSLSLNFRVLLPSAISSANNAYGEQTSELKVMKSNKKALDSSLSNSILKFAKSIVKGKNL